MSPVKFRKCCVVLSILRVKGPTFIQYGKDNVISNISSVKGKEVSNKGIRITLLTKP